MATVAINQLAILPIFCQDRHTLVLDEGNPSQLADQQRSDREYYWFVRDDRPSCVGLLILKEVLYIPASEQFFHP
jgi:hypothetical protein